METTTIGPDKLDRIYVYCTRLHATECDLRVRIEQGVPGRPVRVVGPFTPYHRTVPEVYSCGQLMSANDSFGEYHFLIPEPCFWRPDSPFLYRVDISSDDREEAERSGSLWIGLRHLRTHKEELWLTGQLWRPRGLLLTPGVGKAIAEDGDLIQRVRATGMELLVLRVPGAQFAAACSRYGVALFALLPWSVSEAERYVRRLRDEAAVLAWGTVEEAGADSKLFELTRTLDPVRPFFVVRSDWSAVVFGQPGGLVRLAVCGEVPLGELLEGTSVGDLLPGELLRVRAEADR